MVQILKKRIFRSIGTLRPPWLIVLLLAAAGFVAACHCCATGGLGQFPGTQGKDLARRRSP